MIPIAVLAAILVYTGAKLVNPQQMRDVAKFGHGEVFIYFPTLAGIVALDLLKGVIIGIVLVVMKLVYTFTHPRIQSQWWQDGRGIDLYMKGGRGFCSVSEVSDSAGIRADGDGTAPAF